METSTTSRSGEQGVPAKTSGHQPRPTAPRATLPSVNPDMKLTIDRAVFGKMTNMGQSCVAAKRFILLQSVSDEFVDGFRERLAALKMGDPLDESTGVAPLSS